MQFNNGSEHGQDSPRFKWCVICQRWIPSEQVDQNVEEWHLHKEIHKPTKMPSVKR